MHEFKQVSAAMDLAPSTKAPSAGAAPAIQQLMRTLTAIAPAFQAMTPEEEDEIREAQIKSDQEARKARAAEKRAAKAAAAAAAGPGKPHAAQGTSTSSRMASYLQQQLNVKGASGPRINIDHEARARTRPPPTRLLEGATQGATHTPRLAARLRDLGGRIHLAKEQRLAFVAQLAAQGTRALDHDTEAGLASPPPTPRLGHHTPRSRTRRAGPASATHRPPSVASAARKEALEQAAEASLLYGRDQPAVKPDEGWPVLVVLFGQPGTEAALWRRRGPPGAAPVRLLQLDPQGHGGSAAHALLFGLEAALRQKAHVIWVGRRARMVGEINWAALLGTPEVGAPSAGGAKEHAPARPAIVAGPEGEVLFVAAARVGPLRAVLESRCLRAASGGVHPNLALPPPDPHKAVDDLAIKLLARYGVAVVDMPQALPATLLPADALPPMPTANEELREVRSPLLPPRAPERGAMFRGAGNGDQADPRVHARRFAGRGSRAHQTDRAPGARNVLRSASVTDTVRRILVRKREEREDFGATPSGDLRWNPSPAGTAMASRVTPSEAKGSAQRLA